MGFDRESNRCATSGTLSRTRFACELVNPTVASPEKGMVTALSVGEVEYDAGAKGSAVALMLRSLYADGIDGE